MPTSVKSKEALMAHHLREAVEDVLVHELSHQGAAAPLTVHAVAPTATEEQKQSFI